MTQILDGKKLAGILLEKLEQRIENVRKQGYPSPGLGIITAGDDPAGEVYVRNKLKKASELGFFTKHIKAESDEKKLMEIINSFNRDSKIHGYIVQLPLPENINEKKIIESISPQKDADGFHPLNLGKIITESALVYPATPFGITELFKHYQIKTEGKHIVIAGRSVIVGKPMAMMNVSKSAFGNAAVTLLHSRVENPEFYTQQADIFISSVGKPKIWKKEHFKPGVIVIDVGINTDEQGKLCGDVDFDDVKRIAKAITPVPGGVGPLTVVSLLMNVLKLYEVQEKVSIY